MMLKCLASLVLVACAVAQIDIGDPGAIDPGTMAPASGAPMSGTTAGGIVDAGITTGPAATDAAPMADTTLMAVLTTMAQDAQTTMAPMTTGDMMSTVDPEAPVTMEPTTMAPTTMEPTTIAPTTMEPTTMAPTTMAPSTTPSIPVSTGKNCNNQKADIVFLVDASGSVGSTNFMKQLDYIISVTGNLNVAPDGVRVGLVTFSDDAHLQFNLDAHMDKNILMMALGFVPYQSGSTYTDEGLKYVRENSFLTQNGGRDDAQNVVIVMTDGQSTEPALTKSEARALRKNGTIIISVGIGAGVDKTELENIASGSNYSIMAQDFNSLDQTLDLITPLTCDAINGVAPTELYVACQQRAVDLAFLFDSSGSEGSTNFHKQLDFAQEFVKVLDVGPTKYQIAAATFGTRVNRQFYLNQYDTTQNVVDALGRIPYQGGSTYTQLALAFAKDTIFTPTYGRRPGTPKVVVLMTDGQSTNPQETKQQADLLKQEGFIVYVLGIGNGVNMPEVTYIASDPAHAFQVASFSDLQAFLPTLQQSYCSKVDEVDPIIPTPAVTTCAAQVSDVIFVLDSSSSEGSTNFRKQVWFAGNITKDLPIGRGQVQVGLMTFSSNPTKHFYLSDHDNKYDVLDAIATTPYLSGATYTDEALKFTREQMMSTLHGRRLGAQTVVIVLTDGQSTRPSETMAEAARLRRTGAVVISIGIGSNVDEPELDAIASDPTHKFNVAKFDYLTAIEEQILKETCEGTGPTVAPHPECGNKPSDIVFLMDASSSEGASNFEKMKGFIADFTSQFVVGPNNVQVSCVAFSTRVHVEFPLNSTTNNFELLGKISNIPYYGGTTMTDKALEAVRLQVLTDAMGARAGAKDTVILLTDGNSVVASETRRQADLLKAMGAQVIAIGVGSSIDQRELEAIASDVQHAFSVINFDALDTIEQEIVDTACFACANTEEADILLIIDSSSNESAALFQKEMDFVGNLADTFTIGPKNAQFALMTFATKVNMEFWFNTHSTAQDIKDNLQRIIYSQGDTNTHLALQFAREYAYLPFHGARVTNQYAIIVTDGRASNLTATIAEADKLKAQGVTVMALGIGANADKAELEAIASDPSHVFIADTKDALDEIHKDITKRTCKSIFELQATTMPPPVDT